MIKFENVVTPSGEQWESLILGARNAMNSWNKSDSHKCSSYDIDCDYCKRNMYKCGKFYIGDNDLDLMKRLRNAGTDHRKFMRMITVYVDITAPMYWWSEFDTYKVGTVANSCSKMHKIHAKEFTLEDFSCEHLLDDWNAEDEYDHITGLENLKKLTHDLNFYREKYLETKDKKYWWQMIQLLPSSYNQKRTVMLNYEVLANIYKSRRNHKLDEWSIGFMDWIETLPYSELITNEV